MQIKLNKLFILFIVVLGFSGWRFINPPEIKMAEWLLGTWENNTSRGSIFETWTKVNDSVFFAKSYIIKGDERVVLETIQMIQKKDNLYYIPTVKNQNQNLSVSFQLKKISNTELIFENQEHDFPQVISYTRITSDSLVAKITGIVNNQIHNQTFPMRRIKLY